MESQLRIFQKSAVGRPLAKIQWWVLGFLRILLRVDAWAAKIDGGIPRADAIRRLVELGLRAKSAKKREAPKQ